MRRRIVVIAIAALAAGSLSIPTAAQATTSTASALAAQLLVAAPNPVGYSSDLFGGWTSTTDDGCDTGEHLLKSQSLVPVTFVSGCAVATGQWLSWYDNQTWTRASDLSIDHLVPLAEAWSSGASNWTQAQRNLFANDTLGDELQLVTSSISVAKADQDPAAWVPPSASAECRYVTDWVVEKYRWSLHVDAAEQTAIATYLAHDGCGDQRIAVPELQIPTTVTFPTVTATPACGNAPGSINVTGGSGLTLVFTDTNNHPFTNLSSVVAGDYLVHAAVNEGQYLHSPDLAAGWADADHSDLNFHDLLLHALSRIIVSDNCTIVPGTAQMNPGATLAQGVSLVSYEHGFHVDMQYDGNLVAYNSAHVALWNSRTFVPGSHASMQVDGNLVVYSPSGRALWNSHTSGASGAYAIIQSDGNFVVYQSSRALFNTFADQPPPPAAVDLTRVTDYTLSAGEMLASGQALTHADYRAVMQADGNFVVYQGTTALWSSNTSVAGSVLNMQADGNMVISAPAGYAVWSTNSSSVAGAASRVVMQLDGNLVVYRPDGSAVWHRLHDTGSAVPPPPPPTAQYTLSAVGSMNAGDQLVYGSFRATMQPDGNFVVYNGSSAIWNSRTFVAGSHLALQADGNIVIYAPSGTAIWTTRTSGVTRFVMQADGNLVAYRADGSAAWHRLHDTSARLS